ncbi:MAG: hypothetical protein ACMG57_03655 [Candidatus Dojkabacteria bacterium]
MDKFILNNEIFKKKLKLKAAILFSIVAFSLTGITTGAFNALFTEPSNFSYKVTSLLNGDIDFKDFLKFIIENSGRTDVCKQAGRQGGDAIMGNSEVYDSSSSLIGYAVNNTYLCVEGLTGIKKDFWESNLTNLEVIENFPVLMGFELKVSTLENDQKIGKYYYNNMIIGIAYNFQSSSNPKLVSGADYYDEISKVNPDIVLGFQPMPTTHNVGNMIPYPNYYSSEIADNEYDWKVSWEEILDNPAYVVTSYDNSSKNLELGTLTSEQYESILANGGFMYVNAFPVELKEDRAGAFSVYKTASMVVMCSAGGEVSFLNITGNTYAGPDLNFGEKESHIPLEVRSAFYAQWVLYQMENGVCVLGDDAQMDYSVVNNGDTISPLWQLTESNRQPLVTPLNNYGSDAENRFNKQNPGLIIQAEP